MAEDLGNLVLRTTGDVSGLTTSLRTGERALDTFVDHSAQANDQLVNHAEQATREIEQIYSDRSIFAGFADGLRNLEADAVETTVTVGTAVFGLKTGFDLVTSSIAPARQAAASLWDETIKGGRFALKILTDNSSALGQFVRNAGLLGTILTTASWAHGRTADIAQMSDADTPDAFQRFGLGQMRAASEETIALARQAQSDWQASGANLRRVGNVISTTTSEIATDVAGFFSDLWQPQIVNRAAAEVDATFAAGTNAITEVVTSYVDWLRNTQVRWRTAQLIDAAISGQGWRDVSGGVGMSGDIATIGTRQITQAEVALEEANNARRLREAQIQELNDEARLLGFAQEGAEATERELAAVLEIRRHREAMIEQGTAESTAEGLLERRRLQLLQDLAREADRLPAGPSTAGDWDGFDWDGGISQAGQERAAAEEERLRLLSDQEDALRRQKTILDSLLTPLQRAQQAEASILDLRQRGLINSEQQGLALAQQFLQLERSLGGARQNLNVPIIDPRSVQGGQFETNLLLQARAQGGNAADRVRQVLEALDEKARQQVRELRDIARALRNAPPLRPANIGE